MKIKKDFSQTYICTVFNGSFEFFTCTYVASSGFKLEKLFITKPRCNIDPSYVEEEPYILIHLDISPNPTDPKKWLIKEKWANKRQYLQCIKLKCKPLSEWNQHDSSQDIY